MTDPSFPLPVVVETPLKFSAEDYAIQAAHPRNRGLWTGDLLREASRLRALVDQQAAEIQRLTAIQEGARQVWQEERETLEAEVNEAQRFLGSRVLEEWTRGNIAETALAACPSPADRARALEMAQDAGEANQRGDEDTANLYWAEACRLAGLSDAKEAPAVLTERRGPATNPEMHPEVLQLSKLTCCEPVGSLDVTSVSRPGLPAPQTATAALSGYCAVCYHALDRCSHCDRPSVVAPVTAEATTGGDDAAAARVGDPALAGTGVAADGASSDVAVRMTLPRYGIQHFSLTEPICRPMPDGHWTPWHQAADALDTLTRTDRCHHSGNPVNTDTHPPDRPCPCLPCQLDTLTRERDEARADRENAEHAYSYLSAMLTRDTAHAWDDILHAAEQQVRQLTASETARRTAEQEAETTITKLQEQLLEAREAVTTNAAQIVSLTVRLGVAEQERDMTIALQAGADRVAADNFETCARLTQERDMATANCATLVKAEEMYRANERYALERLSRVLTGGNASQWEHIYHAAEQAHTALLDQVLAIVNRHREQWDPADRRSLGVLYAELAALRQS